MRRSRRFGKPLADSSQTAAPKRGESPSSAIPSPPSESALDVLRRKLEHLLVAQAKNADPIRGFSLKEEIREVRSQIEELEPLRSGPSAPSPSRIARDLSVAIASEPENTFRYFGSMLHAALLSFPNLRASAEYDFSALAKAIHLASKPLNESIELFNLGKDEFAKQELVAGLCYLIVALAQCCERSNVLSKTLVAVCDAVLSIDDIPYELDSSCERNLYGLAIWSQSARDPQLEDLLNRWVKPCR